VGRLTRKERAAFLVRRGNAITLSKKQEKIDYSSDAKILKFGMSAVKCWIIKKEIPALYVFRFKFESYKPLSNKLLFTQ
jgi:ribosomal protein S3